MMDGYQPRLWPRSTTKTYRSTKVLVLHEEEEETEEARTFFRRDCTENSFSSAKTLIFILLTYNTFHFLLPTPTLTGLTLQHTHLHYSSRGNCVYFYLVHVSLTEHVASKHQILLAELRKSSREEKRYEMEELVQGMQRESSTW